MAAVALVLGGAAGFMIAMACMLVFGITALHALALWSVSGLVVSAALMYARHGAPAATSTLKPARA